MLKLFFVINIVGLNKEQLKGFTSSEDFQKFPFAPISELREVSHIKNPRANPEDILLFLAYSGNDLAGYLGILPDDITARNGEKFHFGWLSTLSVSEKFRGKQIAQKLLYAAEDSYDKSLMITEFTASAEGLYNKLGFFDYLDPKKAVRYYFKSNLAELLPTKKPFFEDNKKWLKRLDHFINIFIPYLSNGKNHLYKITKTFDKDLEKFINQQKTNPIGRSSSEFRWILDSPWLSREREQPNYLFSSFSKDYEMFWVSVYQQQEIVATMLCSVRNTHLKVLYYFGNENLISDILPKIIKKYKVKMMTIFDDKLNDSIDKNKSPCAIYKRQLVRKYLIHKDLKERIGENFNYDFKDGDGDFSFT
ncbi:hypothetical protein AXA65_00025 [Chryseobacterium sp. FP211-J200]|nr:hypothetical protein AXA65_00025 [Chryseobacterium sp. FP211-J200]